MKQLFILFTFCIAFSSAAFAQTNPSPAATNTAVLLEGTWAVETKDFLPVVETGRKEYMRDSLVFMPGKQFKNGHRAGLQLAMYEYDAAEGLLSIIDVKSLEGIAYEVAELSQQKLVVMVANKEQTTLIKLTYNRVKN